MRDIPSADPRDQAIRAALRDASTLAAMVVTEFTASYWGAERAIYVATVASYVTDLGGRLEEAGTRDLVADIGGRRIAFIAGAEERSQRELGRPLTADELRRVLDRYPGDLPER